MNLDHRLLNERNKYRSPLILSLVTLLSNTGIIHAQIIPTQNFAFNGSFEEVASCPNGEGGIYLANHYFRSIGTSTDLFARCGAPDVSVPKNRVGNIEAYQGDNMAGIIATTKGYRYYDYIIGTLDHEHMIHGRSYCVSMNVSLAYQSPWALDQLAISFCDSNTWEIRELPSGQRYSFNPVVMRDYPFTALGKDQDLTEREDWVTIKGRITYRTGMKYFWIGANHKELKGLTPMNDVQRVFDPDRTAYYFVDDIRIYEEDPEDLWLSVELITSCTSPEMHLSVPGTPEQVWWYRNGQRIPDRDGRTFVTSGSDRLNEITAHATYDLLCDTLEFAVNPEDRIEIPSDVNTYYPNPSFGNLNLSLYADSEVITDIYDMKGAFIRQYVFTGLSGYSTLNIPVDDMAPGMYFIRSSSGDCEWQAKVVIDPKSER